MKRIVPAVLCAILSLSLLSACAKPIESPISAAKLLNLGEKYLLELNYENALVQFLIVIEIEPINPRGYTGAAEAYVGLGDIESAVAVLEQGKRVLPDNAGIQSMMNDLQQESVNAWEQERPQEFETGAPDDAETDSESEPNRELAQGEYIWSTIPEGGSLEYRMTLVDGIPQAMGTHTADNGVTTMIMAYMRSIDEDGNWSEWEPSPHYWAGLRCSDCGEEITSDGSMPEWFQTGFSHPWSGVWDGEPKVFYDDF